MNPKNSRRAEQILETQHDDGTWGLMFHSMVLNQSSNKPLTTEQALFRLKTRGFDLTDEPIRRTVDCMKACLRGERKIDDYWEKTHDWTLFTRLMLSAWVKLFDPSCELSLSFARQWADVIEKAFAGGTFRQDDYIGAYVSSFGKKPRGAREIDFVDFYHLSLLQGMLTPGTENLLLDYVIAKPEGIFYLYDKQLGSLPPVFASKQASHYVGALELLAGYGLAKGKLAFATDWLYENRDENEQWDFSSVANDGAYFPLSDSWRKSEDRKADCTERITTFLQKLEDVSI